MNPDNTIEPAAEMPGTAATAPEAAPAQADSPTGRERKYRTELRAEQARSAELQQQIEALQSAEIYRLAAQRLADPADALRDSQVNDFLGDDGQVDPALLDLQVDAVLATHPNYAAPPTPSWPKPPSAGGRIGSPALSVLDSDGSASEGVSDWHTLLSNVATGTNQER